MSLSILFGGPSQAEPTDPRGPIQMAQQVADSSETIKHPNQYTNNLVSIHQVGYCRLVHV